MLPGPGPSSKANLKEMWIVTASKEIVQGKDGDKIAIWKMIGSAFSTKARSSAFRPGFDLVF